MTEPSFPERAAMRAGDSDRDRTAQVLGQALAEGRLSPAEHAERLDAAFSATTIGELEALVTDLPVAEPTHLSLPVPPRPGRTPAAPPPAGGDAERQTTVAVFSGTVRRGRWWVPPETRTICVFGGATFDLREASFSQQHVTIRAICVFGGVDITVPEGMHVDDSGFCLFGGIDVPPSAPAAPDAPTLHVKGFCLFGGISVRYRRRKDRK